MSGSIILRWYSNNYLKEAVKNLNDNNNNNAIIIIICRLLGFFSGGREVWGKVYFFNLENVLLVFLNYFCYISMLK